MAFSEKLKQLRKEKGLSQLELAERAGLNINLISKYETNRLAPALENLKKLARALEITIDYLAFDDVPKNGIPKVRDLRLLEKLKIIEEMDGDTRKIVETIIDAIIMKNQGEGMVKHQLDK